MSKLVSARFIRYVFIGLLNTGLFFGLVNLFGWAFHVYSGWRFTAISVFATSVVVVHSYLWNSRWVFKLHESHSTQRFIKFVLSTIGAIGLNAGIVYGMTTLISPPSLLTALSDRTDLIWANVAEVVSLAAVVIWNYTCYKFFVFREPKTNEHGV